MFYGKRASTRYFAGEAPMSASQTSLAEALGASHDDLAVRLLPLREARRTLNGANRVVDDLAFVGVHRFELDLCSPFLGPLGHRSGVLGEGFPAAGPGAPPLAEGAHPP